MYVKSTLSSFSAATTAIIPDSFFLNSMTVTNTKTSVVTWHFAGCVHHSTAANIMSIFQLLHVIASAMLL